MTDEEALALKPGQLVRTKTAGGVAVVFVVGATQWSGVHVVLRRMGKDRLGRNKAAFRRRPEQIQAAMLDSIPANIYADWLEEHGEPAAAAKLRAAFPFVDTSSIKS